MRQGDVAHKDKTERHPISWRQRDEAQKAAEPGERQGYPDCADHDGRGDKRRTGSAFKKRNLRGADDVDDERLCEQGFDEPAALEQSGIAPGVEAVEHQEIRDIVEDRADWADEQNEFRDVADVPPPRHGQVFGVDVVGRDRGLREVVQQVVGEHLNRRHRQKRQEDAGAEHAEHVAEIRAGAHLDIFGDVAEHFAALDHAVAEHRQALFEQDDVRGVLGDVDRAVHGYADIRGLQRRSVVDAIAKESDDVSLPVQGVDDRSLLRRRDLGKHGGRLGQALPVRPATTSLSRCRERYGPRPGRLHGKSSG